MKEKTATFRCACKIKRHEEISDLFRTGTRWKSNQCSVFSMDNGKKQNRCAVIVKKEKITAVERNKKKRIVREYFRHYLKTTPPHTDILIKVHSSENGKRSTIELEKELFQWLKKQEK